MTFLLFPVLGTPSWDNEEGLCPYPCLSETGNILSFQVGNRWLKGCGEDLGNQFSPHHSVIYFKIRDDACGFLISLVRWYVP